LPDILLFFEQNVFLKNIFKRNFVMRRIFATLLLFFVAFIAPAYAGPCSIDGASYEDDMAFVPCPIGDTNNFLIDSGYNSARLPVGVGLSHTPIYVHNTCRYVDSRGIQNPLFIPFNTPTEWMSFVTSTVPGVHTAECCVPRPLRVTDVPVPSETCTTGWQFVGLANPDNTGQLLASQLGTGFAFENGYSEQASYPIQKLPLQRGDVGAQVPNDGLNAYVGKFYCAGEVDFGTSTSPVTVTTTSSSSSWSWSQISGTNNEVFVVGDNSSSTTSGRSVTGRSAKAVSGNASTQTVTSGKATGVTKFMGFTMQCANNQWKHTSPSCFGKTTGVEISNCPNGASGRIVTSLIRQCDGTTVSQVTENTCQQTCTPKTVTTEERQCPTGKQGKITVEVTKSCFGRKPVSNQSTAGGSCDCTTSEKITGDTCRDVCVPYTDLGSEERECPEGEEGKIKVKKKRVCHEAEDCGEMKCICEDKEQVTENTCKKICPPKTDLGTETRQCPAGQEGEIVVKKTRECREENQCGNSGHNHDNQSYGAGHDTGKQCKCKDKEETIKNTCKDVCQPYEREETFQCPAGQTGSIVKIFRKICDCPGGREEVIVKSNTCTETCPVGRKLLRSWKDSCLGGKKVYEEYEVTYISTGEECKDGSVFGYNLNEDGSVRECEKTTPGQCLTRKETIRVKNSCWFSPLVLDMGADGLDLSSLENSGVKFDMDLDGINDPTGWIGTQEAFLVLDKNNDGLINNRSEMFGNLDAYENGFSLLASYDDNNDGVMDNRDWIFSRLRLWIDSNSDGVSQPEELFTLPSLDVTSINLAFTSPGTILDGNLLGQQSSFTFGSGTTADIFDVWFAVEGSK
jgi:hypothetical protein